MWAIGVEGDRVGFEAAVPGRLQQPEEPGLSERLDGLRRDTAGVLCLLGALAEDRQQVGDPGYHLV